MLETCTVSPSQPSTVVSSAISSGIEAEEDEESSSSEIELIADKEEKDDDDDKGHSNRGLIGSSPKLLWLLPPAKAASASTPSALDDGPGAA